MKNIALYLVGTLLVAGCASSGDYGEPAYFDTPTVDYVEGLDVYSATHRDSFLNQLAMNYRSYAIYNARTSGFPDIGEQFAHKAIAAFSGETPFPERVEDWPVDNQQLSFALNEGARKLIEELKNDGADRAPEIAAEAQAKFDCWLSASASGQYETAQECEVRFNNALNALQNCDKPVALSAITEVIETTEMRRREQRTPRAVYYPETGGLNAMSGAGRARDGVIVVNNVNIPEHLINPVPVQPLVFNQHIHGGDTVAGGEEIVEIVSDDSVTRAEFIDMMLAMRSELAAINARLDKIESAKSETTMIKVQQIPLEPKQHVMEEVFEVRFDFDKSKIKPEYEDLIRKLVKATCENKNIKVTVVGHTDTMGSKSYNFALGGRRADAVKNMLVKYGIPASQITSVSSGEQDLKVQTGDNVANAENRRVRVTKEVHYTEPAEPSEMVVVEEVIVK